MNGKYPRRQSHKRIRMRDTGCGIQDARCAHGARILLSKTLTFSPLLVCLLTTWFSAVFADAADSNAQPVNIGSRLELFVDDWMIDKLDGATLELQHPVPQNDVFVADAPWEGNCSVITTLFHDGEVYRMYYRGLMRDMQKPLKRLPNGDGQHEYYCCAVSDDGIHWQRPSFGLFEHEGSKENNIVAMGEKACGFAPMLDENPDCRADEKYKAIGGRYRLGLFVWSSPDGVHWKLMQEEPIIPWVPNDANGRFDSVNLAFWDTLRKKYFEFHRGYPNELRTVMVSTSDDFLHWEGLQYIQLGDVEPQHLYTNSTMPYYRAPHIFLAFPCRFMENRQPVTPHWDEGINDSLLMSSRDGLHFHRWDEAFLRPGQNPTRWWQRNNYIGAGMLETKSSLPGGRPELSFYSRENYYVGAGTHAPRDIGPEPCRFRRYTLRVDGFVSVNAPYRGGEMVTRPFIFSGKKLVVNFATSGAGSIRFELQDADGNPLPGYTLDDSPELYGDELEQTASWIDDAPSNLTDDVSRHAGNPVRLRAVLKDADLFSMQFK